MSTRSYTVHARTNDTHGRMLCNARDHHFVMDEPTWNGCPGEAMLPGEAFLTAVAACVVELAQVIAKAEGIAIGDVKAVVEATLDRDNPVREDLTVFNRVDLRFEIDSVSDEQARYLADAVARRCPLYGSVKASAPEFNVDVVTT